MQTPDGDADFVAEQEAVWIDRARQGQMAAWEFLLRQHQTAVFRLAYLVLGDAAEAEDVTQETFIKAYLAFASFDAERPFRPWLLTIAINLARNRKRSIGRYWAALQRWLNQEVVARSSSADSWETQQVWQAIQKLRPVSQEILYLRYFLDLSEAETAETLHIPLGTAKSRLHRALHQLRDVLQEQSYGRS